MTIEINNLKKYKVVWICHFSNIEVRERLPLSKKRIYNWFRKLLDKPEKRVHRDFAPWVNNLIKEFELFRNVDLHIISPHIGLILPYKSFQLRGINYHFFKSDILLIKVINRMLKNPKYRFNRYLISHFINNIKPNLVNLIGAENPYYSLSALDIKNIPVYLSCQTVYSNPLQAIHSKVDKNIWDHEVTIHKKIQYFGCMGRLHRDLVLKNNPEAIVFKMFFAILRPKGIKQLKKEFDFVFFAAGVTEHKGIEDALKALAIVKKKKQSVSLNVVGSCNAQYKTKLLKLILDLGIQDNVVFNDFFPVHSDMYQHITKAHVSVLPNRLDIISTTIVEAILLDIPVVTSKTTGTPYLNRDGESVLISDIGDITGLASNMLKLLNNPVLANKLIKKSKAFLEKEFNNTTSAKRLLNNYTAVINHYYQNIPIPNEQLFSIEEFAKYE